MIAYLACRNAAYVVHLLLLGGKALSDLPRLLIYNAWLSCPTNDDLLS